MQDLITVVVPVYNCAPYLDACLQSLQAQTWQNWEAILVDDGSTDESWRICQAYHGKDPRFTVVHQENAGVSAARNAGIAAAQGRYLAFMDGDDRIDPAYLQVLYETLGDSQLAVCCVDDTFCYDGLIPRETISLRTLRVTPSRYASLIYINYSINKLYRMSIIRAAGLRFPINTHRSEDVNFVQDYLMHCRSISITPQILYHYDQHDGSAMHRFYAGVCADEIPLMQRQYDLFHPDGPNSLTAEEETAFQRWQYGKVLGILRYIVQYAPNRSVRLGQIKELFSNNLAKASMLNPPSGTGRKAQLAAFLLRMHAWDGLVGLLKTM